MEGAFCFFEQWWGGVDVEGQGSLSKSNWSQTTYREGELRPWRPGAWVQEAVCTGNYRER